MLRASMKVGCLLDEQNVHGSVMRMTMKRLHENACKNLFVKMSNSHMYESVVTVSSSSLHTMRLALRNHYSARQEKIYNDGSILTGHPTVVGVSQALLHPFPSGDRHQLKACINRAPYSILLDTTPTPCRKLRPDKNIRQVYRNNIHQGPGTSTRTRGSLDQLRFHVLKRFKAVKRCAIHGPSQIRKKQPCSRP